MILLVVLGLPQRRHVATQSSGGADRAPPLPGEVRILVPRVPVVLLVGRARVTVVPAAGATADAAQSLVVVVVNDVVACNPTAVLVILDGSRDDQGQGAGAAYRDLVVVVRQLLAPCRRRRASKTDGRDCYLAMGRGWGTEATCSCCCTAGRGCRRRHRVGGFRHLRAAHSRERRQHTHTAGERRLQARKLPGRCRRQQ